MTEHPRFLVLRGGAIGDFIMTLPALQALRERWPGAHVELVGYPHVAELAVDAGLVNRLRSLDEAGMARFFSLKPAFTDDQRDYVASFDIVLNYLHDPEDVVGGNLAQAGARQVIYCSPIVTAGHAADHMLKPLQELAIYPDCRHPVLHPSEKTLKDGRKWLKKHKLTGDVVAVHPGSGSPAKNWALERFLEVIQHLVEEQGKKIVMLLGEADEEIVKALPESIKGCERLQRANLKEVAGVLANCKGYLGNDSGITHLASAVGIPVVALFGPSDPDKWAPRGERARTIFAPGTDLDALEVSTVLRSI